MMECGEHLAKVVMSSARRLCVLARLSNNIHAHMCVYIELAQNHFLSHLSVVAFCLVTRFDSQEVQDWQWFFCLQILCNGDWPGPSKVCWCANRKEFKFVFYHSGLSSKYFLTPYIMNLCADMNFGYLVYFDSVRFLAGIVNALPKLSV